MRKKAIIMASCVIAGSAVIAGSTDVNAQTTLGGGAVAGVSSALTDSLADISASTTESATEEVAAVTENEVPTESTSQYADIAIAQVEGYVNIRSSASEDADVLGKLYNNGAGTVIGTEGDWTQIQSGSVTGYVKSEFVVVGDDALAEEVSTKLATVNTTTLKVRSEASTDAAVTDMVPEGDTLTVTSETDGWVGVSLESGDGYVSSEFVSCETVFEQAESKEEEEARLAAEAAAKEAEEKAAAEKAAAEKAAAASKSSSSSSSSSSSESTQTYANPTGSSGSAVASYAAQFVGNPYVYGGTSLTNGADCSGFVMSVYAAFGVSLPHSSSGMRSVGYEVSRDAIQAGDIVCYDGHVGIYDGAGSIINASTAATGIKYTNVDYKSIITIRRIF